MIGRPDLVKKFELDVIACNGEAAKTDLSVAPAIRRDRAAEAITEGCMAQREYVIHEPQGAPTASLSCVAYSRTVESPGRTRGEVGRDFCLPTGDGVTATS